MIDFVNYYEIKRKRLLEIVGIPLDELFQIFSKKDWYKDSISNKDNSIKISKVVAGNIILSNLKVIKCVKEYYRPIGCNKKIATTSNAYLNCVKTNRLLFSDAYAHGKYHYNTQCHLCHAECILLYKAGILKKIK